MTKTKTNIKKEVLGIPAPKKAQDSKFHDRNCPFTGSLKVKKEFLKGKVIKRDMNKSATIEWERASYVPKYERYQMKRSRLRVHNPPCIDAQIGWNVLVARTRPLSKTKNHVILQIIDEGSIEVVAEENSAKKQGKKVKKDVKEDNKENQDKEESNEDKNQEITEETNESA